MKLHITVPDGELGHAPWQPGEAITVHITGVVHAEGASGDTYEAETMETIPHDIKDRHAAELQALTEQHAAQMAEVTGGNGASN